MNYVTIKNGVVSPIERKQLYYKDRYLIYSQTFNDLTEEYQRYEFNGFDKNIVPTSINKIIIDADIEFNMPDEGIGDEFVDNKFDILTIDSEGYNGDDNHKCILVCSLYNGSNKNNINLALGVNGPYRKYNYFQYTVPFIETKHINIEIGQSYAGNIILGHYLNFNGERVYQRTNFEYVWTEVIKTFSGKPKIRARIMRNDNYKYNSYIKPINIKIRYA